jgi:hypothetical protein
MLRAAAALPGAAADAEAALAADEEVSPERLAPVFEEWRREGPPESLRAIWREAGFPEAALQQLEQGMRELTAPPEPAAVLRDLVSAVSGLAREVDAEGRSILALEDGK